MPRSPKELSGITKHFPLIYFSTQHNKLCVQLHAIQSPPIRPARTSPRARPRPRSAPRRRRPRDLKPTDPAVGRLAGLGRAATVTLVPARKVVVCANTTNPVAWPRRPAAPRPRRRRQRSQRVQRRASCGARAVAREVARLAALKAPRPTCGNTAAPHSFDRLDHVGRRVAHGQACLLEPLNDGVGIERLELGERVQRRRVEASAHGLA